MLPQPMVDPELLTMPTLALCNKLATQCWLTTLILPWCLHWVKLLWMISLSIFFFMTLGYLDWVWVERMRMDLVLLICGENRHAKTDVCIIDWSHNDILLLVQEDKKLGRGRHAQAQLVWQKQSWPFTRIMCIGKQLDSLDSISSCRSKSRPCQTEQKKYHWCNFFWGQWHPGLQGLLCHTHVHIWAVQLSHNPIL